MNVKFAIKVGEDNEYYYASSQELESCVQYYIHLNYKTENLNNHFVAPFPNGEIYFYFHLGESGMLVQQNNTINIAKHFLIGPFDQSDYVYLKPFSKEQYYNSIIIKVTLNSFYNYSNKPLYSLKNKIIEVKEFWGVDGIKFVNELNNITDVKLFINKIDEFFARHFCYKRNKNQSKLIKLIEYSIKKEGNLTVENLSKATKIRYRTIHRIFSKKVGICPKEYLRIIRFNKVCSLLKKYPFVDWSELVYSCGYYDQSHFIHDFRNFMQLSPEEFIIRLKSNYYTAHPVMYSL